MRAIALDRFGPPSVLRLHHLPIPSPGAGEVLIRLHTIGVGVWDASIRDGTWKRPGRPRFPLVPGTDGAGEIVALGPRVSRWRIGDRVYGYEFGNPQGGFYAEYVVVAASAIGRVPALRRREAGAIGAPGLTALQGVQRLRLRGGETTLIFGASGTVGTIALQFAKYRGARVLATATGPAASRAVRALGADGVIDARGHDLAEQVQKLAPDGIDAVLALAGGPALQRCLEQVNRGGRVIHTNGIDHPPRRRKRLKIAGFDVRATPAEFSHLNRWIKGSRLRVPIAATYPLERAADAHRRLDHQQVIGRIVLAVS